MSPPTADPHPGVPAGDWLLRLDADAWFLTTPAGTRRQPVEEAPALQLERMETKPAGPRTRLRVVLGDGWLRYLVLRWPQGVRRAAERHAYLVHRFREVHGVGEPEWVLAADRSAVSFPALACAAPASLVGAVQSFAARRSLALESVAGDFVAHFNGMQAAFREPAGAPAALAVARSGRVTVGLWRDGAWQALRSQPLGSDGAADVKRMLDQWRVEAGTGDSPGVLYACGLKASAPAGWRVEEGSEAAWV